MSGRLILDWTAIRESIEVAFRGQFVGLDDDSEATALKVGAMIDSCI
jgi:hypothetical protein